MDEAVGNVASKLVDTDARDSSQVASELTYKLPLVTVPDDAGVIARAGD